MIVTYLRSSSIGTYNLCPNQFFLQYQLGIKSKPGFRTERGSLVHKSLELLAHRKVAEQDGRAAFTDPELGREFVAAEITPSLALRVAFDHYSAKNESGHDWSAEDFAECEKNMNAVLDLNGGMFSPLNRHVLAPEQYFDFEIEEDWAGYSYMDPTTDQWIYGKLHCKGAIDCVSRAGPGVIECLDWKTGSRKDWGKNTVKELADLENDPQMLLYFYALSRLYPDYPHVFLTIFYTRDGGPFTLVYDRDRDVPRALAMLRAAFERIKNDKRPRRVMDTKDKWRVCLGFCHYGKTKVPGTNKSVCDTVHAEVQALGVDRVMKKYNANRVHLAYADGGGQSNRETK